MAASGRIVQLSVSGGGGPERAVCLYALETIEALRAVLLEVTRYTSPCANIAPIFRDREYARVSQKRHPGWSRVYARVLRPGVIRPGDPARLVDELEAAEPLAAAS